ncbi:DUF1206 domain-containing protein [Streptomyces lateritius]|uniref:DUF1206 domain-containing protein n=1 Tax=Streptomyces lateritius TaxID=67313 RepID=A0ABW6YLE9_9ACTN
MALWRLSEAIFGQATEGGDTRTRCLGSLGLAVFYIVICIGVVQTALVGGSGGTRAGDESSKDYTARVLEWPFGQILVGVFGASVGVVIVVRSLMLKFEKNLRTGRMSPTKRRVVAVLGIIGGVACGVIAMVTGLFVLLAAVRFDAGEAKGLDETLRSFADPPAGPVLLIASALGLLLFGLYSFCEARWRKALEHDVSADESTAPVPAARAESLNTTRSIRSGCTPGCRGRSRLRVQGAGWDQWHTGARRAARFRERPAGWELR